MATDVVDRERATTTGVEAAFDRTSVVAFFVVAYVLSWAWVIAWAATGHTVVQGQGWPTHFPSLLGPLVAAFVVTAWRRHARGIRDLLTSMARWRIGWRLSLIHI